MEPHRYGDMVNSHLKVCFLTAPLLGRTPPPLVLLQQRCTVECTYLTYYFSRGSLSRNAILMQSRPCGVMLPAVRFLLFGTIPKTLDRCNAPRPQPQPNIMSVPTLEPGPKPARPCHREVAAAQASALGLGEGNIPACGTHRRDSSSHFRSPGHRHRVPQ